ncbi:hypothetical protein N644_2932 [Lactiplantibacillus paraplantarum]|nr:hypothetical protein N644_2932 [Lactiplantibacillus paraplantarum]
MLREITANQQPQFVGSVNESLFEGAQRLVHDLSTGVHLKLY